MTLRKSDENETVTKNETVTEDKGEVMTEAKEVVAKPVSVPAVSNRIVSPLDELENRIEGGTLEFGSVPRFTASNGQIQDSSKKMLGSFMTIRPESFNNLYILSMKEKDDEAKEYIRYSYDNVMCTDGVTTVADAAEAAKAAGYTPSIRTYVELFGILEDVEKGGDEYIDNLVMVSLSPQSVKAFNGFRVQAGLKALRGKLDIAAMERLKISARVESFGSVTFTRFEFAVAE